MAGSSTRTCEPALRVAVLFQFGQLNRQTENRESKRPQLSDLRWAGEIEQDADVVIFPYREHYHLKRATPRDQDEKLRRYDMLEATKHKLELIVAKNRHGDVGDIEMFCAIEASYVRDQ